MSINRKSKERAIDYMEETIESIGKEMKKKGLIIRVLKVLDSDNEFKGFRIYAGNEKFMKGTLLSAEALRWKWTCDSNMKQYFIEKVTELIIKVNEETLEHLEGLL